MKKFIVLFAILLAAGFCFAAGPGGGGTGGGGNGGGGGHTETVGNNLSFPVIWAEGFAKPLRGVFGAPVFFGGDCSLPESPCVIVDGVAWYFQQEEANEWQAESLAAQDTGPVVVSWIDWGDNLESVDWYISSVVRVETVLFKDLSVPMLGFEMMHLYGQGPDEMWGANTLTYMNPQATIYSRCARLTIQKLTKERDDPTLVLQWDAEAGKWTGDVQEALYQNGVWEAADGSGYYSGEINIPGKVIYGYNWNVRRLNQGAGDYRLTFSLDPLYGSAGHCDAALNTIIDASTQILLPAEEITAESEGGGGTAVIDSLNNLTYIDIRILLRSGGGKGRP